MTIHNINILKLQKDILENTIIIKNLTEKNKQLKAELHRLNKSKMSKRSLDNLKLSPLLQHNKLQSSSSINNPKLTNLKKPTKNENNKTT